MSNNKFVLRILGIRGLPAQHGGFETFAEYLSLYLVSKGWRVIVYCQEDGGDEVIKDVWRGVERVRIPISKSGPLGTIIFDWKSVSDASTNRDLCLTLGYNTALFCARLRARGIPNIINMDGIEWSREKWGFIAKAWFWVNDWAGCLLADHLVADHPEIKRHLASRVNERKVTTIAYGAEEIRNSSTNLLHQLHLNSGEYLTVIARAEPENSILEVIQGFSARRRNVKLVVLGNYDINNKYHQAVKKCASDEVVFLGAIYDKDVVQTLRRHSVFYVHGHQVGGTNPSLVEAMGAGNAVLAHNNPFNRWVVGAGAKYFDGSESFDSLLTDVLLKPAEIELMKSESVRRFEMMFTWDNILKQYEELLEKYVSPD